MTTFNAAQHVKDIGDRVMPADAPRDCVDVFAEDESLNLWYTYDDATGKSYLASCVPITADLWMCALWDEDSSLYPDEPTAAYLVDLAEEAKYWDSTEMNDVHHYIDHVLFRRADIQLGLLQETN